MRKTVRNSLLPPLTNSPLNPFPPHCVSQVIPQHTHHGNTRAVMRGRLGREDDNLSCIIIPIPSLSRQPNRCHLPLVDRLTPQDHQPLMACPLTLLVEDRHPWPPLCHSVVVVRGHQQLIYTTVCGGRRAETPQPPDAPEVLVLAAATEPIDQDESHHRRVSAIRPAVHLRGPVGGVKRVRKKWAGTGDTGGQTVFVVPRVENLDAGHQTYLLSSTMESQPPAEYLPLADRLAPADEGRPAAEHAEVIMPQHQRHLAAKVIE
mmetsp:Transcript_34335/g.98904  ORF Transcript_34335/g.98904 Transcript_34335/m.98904 type:complete len:262 (+) Transcript_34335:37-822(+)